MDWNSYEETVRNIYALLGKDQGLRIECHGATCWRTGKSGVSHQIDVLTSHTVDPHQYLAMIECKYWNEKINKDTVMKVSSIVEDCNFSKGIVVSKLGFTADGIEYAKSKNISLVKLDEISKEQGDGRIEEHHIVQLFHPSINKVVILSESEWSVGHCSEDSVFLLPDGNKVTVRQCFDKFSEIFLKEPDKEITGDLSFPEGTVFKGEKDVVVKGIRLRGILRVTQEEFVIKGDEYVSMVMNSFFENKDYLILTNGEIRELGRKYRT